VTVKKAEPLFPDESVTCSEYVPGIVVGWRLNVAEKLPEPSTENCVPVHGTPLKSTSAHFIISYGAKLRPLIVNVEPGIPEVGDRVIAGGGGVTVKTALPLLPEESVTLTGYAPVGWLTLSVSVQEKLPAASIGYVIPVLGIPLKSTSADFTVPFGVKLRPLIVNVEPGLPDAGVMVMVAGGVVIGGAVTVREALAFFPAESITTTA
jgi:hypothetical protein